MAAFIRAHTVVPNAWIAQQLQLGHVSRVSHCARDASKELLRELENCLKATPFFHVHPSATNEDSV
jgi:hypothetical protein